MSPRSRIGENEGGTRTKRTLRRCTKEEDVATGTKSRAPKLIELDENQNAVDRPLTSRRTGSSMSFNSNHLLQAVRQHLCMSNIECPLPHKPTPQHTTKSLDTESPTKSPLKKSRGRKRSGSLAELENGLQTTTATKISNGPIALDASQISASMGYALQDLNVQIRCYERHITTWDAPDHAFFIFPAQLLMICTSERDFNPLVVPDVSIIDLYCTTVAMGGPHNLHRPISFSTFYDGATIRYVNNVPKCNLTRGIHVEGVSSTSWSSTMDSAGRFGWYMRFWIPIPFMLFQRAETRSFKINVRVHINGTRTGRQDGHLRASSDFTLTRLLSGSVM